MLDQIQSLSVERKIGQLFFIGFSGTELNPELEKLVTDISPGGVCLFARNIRTSEQTRKLLDQVRELLQIEPFISLDEEGGVVDRLRRITTPLPSASRISSKGQAEQLAGITAEIIRILGFNMNFAPVVDVVDETREKYSNGLYSRSFGSSKESVVELAGAYFDRLQHDGCLGCLKHFPGLGASQVDSHEELPQVNISSSEIESIDLFPYKKLFNSMEIHSVMIGHASYPELDLQEVDSDGKLLPSSLSYNFTTRLLREELKFSGLTISDDLEMGAILKNYGIGEACVMAINAGMDMLAICANPDFIYEGYQAVLQAVKNNTISEERLDASFERIARLKSLINQPLDFNSDRLNNLSNQIAELNTQLDYSYGG